jgi:hypothetical protein
VDQNLQNKKTCDYHQLRSTEGKANDLRECDCDYGENLEQGAELPEGTNHIASIQANGGR